MDSPSRQSNREEPLNDSWVELHFQQLQGKPGQGQGVRSGIATPENRPIAPLPGLNSGQMEKLLLEAQRESRGSSRYSSQPSSSRGSPKSPHSPNNEMAPAGISGIMAAAADIQPIQEGQVLQAVQKADIPTDWIWDWSSRPEAHPQHNNGNSSDSSSRQYKHPLRSRLSVRNSPVLSGKGGLFDNMSTLLVTHACSFLIGAAAMFLYLKKYCNWAPPIATTPMD